MADGYNAQILWVNLTEGRTEVREPGEEVMRKYIGGAGLAAKILWEETSADTEPFASENPLIFMTGPLTGVAQQSSRHIVAGISPLTNIWGRAHSGGNWADKLRRSGFMGIVIKGKARKPVYLRLYNGEAEIFDASSLWGMDTYEVEELLRRETDGKVSVAAIGRAGEKLVRFAAIMNDGKKGRAAARCGLGALMGSKKLKAIVVGGNQEIPVFDRARLKECTKKIYHSCPRKKLTDVIEDYVEEIKLAFRTGGVPVKNWRGGAFDPAEKFGDSLRGARMGFCSRCPYSDTESMYNSDGERHIIWEHWGPVGTNCLIDNVEGLQESFSLCQRYGLDCISTGGVLAFAMECYEKGLLSEKETGGLALKFGNGELVVSLIEKIANREGIGDLLAEGSRAMSEKLGQGSEHFAMHVKGLELPAYDPRAAKITGLGYVTANRGGDHVTAYVQGPTFIDAPFLLVEDSTIEDPFVANPAEAKVVIDLENALTMFDCIGACKFMGILLPAEDYVQLISHATGWDFSVADFRKSGERIYNLMRVFCVREGISRESDTLPKRLMEDPLPEGPAKGMVIDKDTLEMLKDAYYEMRGWDKETGKPTAEKLAELGLEDITTDMWQ